MLNIAHRGASGHGLAPENTLAAFRLAMDIGADLIELDVHRSKDEKIVVIHDDSLDRTTDRKGSVRDLNFREIMSADAGEGQRVPLLAEALELMHDRAMVLLEIKPNDITGDVIQQIRDCDAADHVIIQSFHPEVVVESFALAPGIPRGLLIGGGDDFAARTCSVGAGLVVPSFNLLNEETVGNVRLRGLGLWTYTIDEPDQMREAVDLGVDGIITNQPDRLKSVLAMS
jgi:glycerophosphoryl diester phosphodiesterase